MPPTGPPPLTPKQQQVLASLRDEIEHRMTVPALAERADTRAQAMRRMCERLVDRRLLKREGRGGDAAYVLTERGAKAIGDREPAPVTPTARRPYVVLQRFSLGEMVRRQVGEFNPELSPEALEELEQTEIFAEIAVVDARNTEDAYKQAVREHQGLFIDPPKLVAVTDRYWQPKDVDIDTRLEVSVR